MKTRALYLLDSYQKTTTATVVELVTAGQTQLYLDKTIFYAQGGGQPADRGSIRGRSGTLEVSHVSYNGGFIAHKGKLQGKITVGEVVELVLDWELRYTHMQLHTAGHVLDQAVKNAVPDTKGVEGDHGIGKRCFVEFDGKIAESDLITIQKEVDAIVAAKLPITTKMMTLDDIERQGIVLPFALPKDKDLRIVQIGEYPPMPDGGTQLRSTAECWPITVTGVQEKEGRWRVGYEVTAPGQARDAEQKPVTQQKPAAQSADQVSGQLSLEELGVSIQALMGQLKAEPATATDLKTKYLSKKGLLNQLMKSLSMVAPDKRPAAGQLLNSLKSALEETIAAKTAQTGTLQDHIDLTMPGIKPNVGHVHPISQAMEEITHIFEKIGFTRVRYPEVDWDWYVFESLNMPPDHPARDEWETFFVDRENHPKMGKMVLTTHTSNGQVREMERLKSTPPIRMINIARCYRRQQDATHTQMFHQFEGLVVDKGITIQHLKGTLDYFAREFYGPEAKSRIRPFHFQFTEPSFEVDFSCHICKGTGRVKATASTSEVSSDGTIKCKFCKSGWHEVGGAGMVHPNVLKAGGIDPDEYTGFAFGWGVERTYTLKPGLNIDDIRLLYSGDLRFLEQF